MVFTSQIYACHVRPTFSILCIIDIIILVQHICIYLEGGLGFHISTFQHVNISTFHHSIFPTFQHFSISTFTLLHNQYFQHFNTSTFPLLYKISIFQHLNSQHFIFPTLNSTFNLEDYKPYVTPTVGSPQVTYFENDCKPLEAAHLLRVFSWKVLLSY